MYREVWSWAGTVRTSEKNLGVAPHDIRPLLRLLLDDVSTWIELASYEAHEIVARFHHRLVAIHVFPNGNGRHARLASDLLAKRLGLAEPSWGGARNVERARDAYLAALRLADARDYRGIVAFLRD